MRQARFLFPLRNRDFDVTEAAAALGKPDLFQLGNGQFRPCFHKDGNLISAGWPKDSRLFAMALAGVLNNLPERVPTQ